jgi:hypothetical protein
LLVTRAAAHGKTGGAENTLNFFGLALGALHLRLILCSHKEEFKKITAF